MIVDFAEEPCTYDRLANAACRAAIDLDNLILERETDNEGVKALMEILENEIGLTQGTASASLIDPSMAVAVTQSMHDLAVQQPSNTIDDAIRFVASTVDELGQAESSDVEKLRRLRAFCVALSRHAATFEHSAVHGDVRHPFRR